jgi:hypothetical protein
MFGLAIPCVGGSRVGIGRWRGRGRHINLYDIPMPLKAGTLSGVVVVKLSEHFDRCPPSVATFMFSFQRQGNVSIDLGLFHLICPAAAAVT